MSIPPSSQHPITSILDDKLSLIVKYTRWGWVFILILTGAGWTAANTLNRINDTELELESKVRNIDLYGTAALGKYIEDSNRDNKEILQALTKLSNDIDWIKSKANK